MFGSLLRVHRQRLGLSQEDLAHRAGIGVRSVRKMESGETERPRPGTARLIADAFGLDGAELTDFLGAAAGLPAPAAEPPAAGDLPVPRQLPPDLAVFAGRHRELGRLDTLLVTAGTAIGVLHGIAGAGKSALAVHWAHRVAGRFPDGQLYANLHGFEPRRPVAEPAAVLAALLDGLAVPPWQVPAGLEARIGLYRSLVAERRLLVVLDNAVDAAQVRPLLPGGTGSVVVVTSRDDLAGLVVGEGAVTVPIEPPPATEAREMLARRLGEARLAAEPGAVDRIVAGCGRLPLALAVVAAKAANHPDLPLAALADRLGEAGRHQDTLEVLDAGDTATDLRAIFEASYGRLDAEAQRLLGILGSGPEAPVSTDAAARMAGLPVRAVRPLLAELSRASLLRDDGTGAYSVHPLLSAFVADLHRDGSGTGGPPATRPE